MKNDVTYLRADLERMSTQQLDEVLQEELQKDPTDGRTVRTILSILEDRETDYLESSTGIEKAWEKYLKDVTAPITKPRRKGGWVLKVASVAVVLFTLAYILPQEVEAKNFFERLISWTDSIFELFSPGDQNIQTEYVFQTDHPGLQEVYDTVTELGITVPVVPMWLPEGYELVECEIKEFSAKTTAWSVFSNGRSEFIFQLDLYSQNITYEFYKDETAITTYEKNGTIFNVMRNKNLSVAVWSIDNIECSISMDCQEDALHRILDSIYVMEEQ